MGFCEGMLHRRLLQSAAVPPYHPIYSFTPMMSTIESSGSVMVDVFSPAPSMVIAMLSNRSWSACFTCWARRRRKLSRASPFGSSLPMLHTMTPQRLWSRSIISFSWREAHAKVLGFVQSSVQ